MPLFAFPALNIISFPLDFIIMDHCKNTYPCLTFFTMVERCHLVSTPACSLKRSIADIQTQPLVILVVILGIVVILISVNIRIPEIYCAVFIGKAPSAWVSFNPVPLHSIGFLSLATIPSIAVACRTVWPPVKLRFISLLLLVIV